MVAGSSRTDMFMFRCRGTLLICELNELHCPVDSRDKLRDTCVCVCVCVCVTYISSHQSTVYIPEAMSFRPTAS